MRVRNDIDVHNILANIQQAGRTSDKLVGIGPFGIGLDGILTWIPGVGELYCLGASAYLLAQGVRARVSGIVLWQLTALFFIDFALGAVPIGGDMLDMVFCAHLWGGAMLRRAIRSTAYIGDEPDVRDPRIDQAMQDGHRVVLLKRS